MACFVVTFALCLQYTSSDDTYMLVTYVRPTNLLRRYTCHWTRYTRTRWRIKRVVIYKQLLALSGFAIYALVAGQRPQMHVLEGVFFPDWWSQFAYISWIQIWPHLKLQQPIPVAARSSAWGSGRYLPGIEGLNPDGDTAVCSLSLLCVAR